jgi:HK97 family phage prohead protease
VRYLMTKAATVATELGQFTAIAAVFGNVDRHGDRIVKGAFANTIDAWHRTGRKVPLHWNHSADPDDIVGSIDPGSMIETGQGLVVEGQLDLDNSDRARQAWRAMKTGSMGLSFGYSVGLKRAAADGATELLELDLFEISLAPAPANASTRVLLMKSAEEDEEDDVRAQARREFYLLLTADPEPEEQPEPTPPDADTLRKEFDAVGFKSRPDVQIATFEC